MNLNELAQKIHKQNYKWWHDVDGVSLKRNRGELLMLAVSELSEALEGIRKNLMDDHLPHRKMEEVEMADAKIRLLDYAGGFGIDVTLVEDAAPAPFGENKGENLLCVCWSICCVLVEDDGESYLCGAIQSIGDYCEKYNLDLDGAMTEKLEYNKTRIDHQHEARAKAEGKKF